jgi:hypothetical protein
MHFYLQSIILLEDVDAAFPNREGDHGEHEQLQSQSSVTFSGLLNVLDGVTAR